MIKPAVLLAIATTLSSCASLTYPLPKCDGYSRRPLNRSMWEWEGNSNLKHQQSSVTSSQSVTPFVEEDRGPEAFEQFDAPQSYRRCEA